jgi:hypothetical protein
MSLTWNVQKHLYSSISSLSELSEIKIYSILPKDFKFPYIQISNLEINNQDDVNNNIKKASFKIEIFDKSTSSKNICIISDIINKSINTEYMASTNISEYQYNIIGVVENGISINLDSNIWHASISKSMICNVLSY